MNIKRKNGLATPLWALVAALLGLAFLAAVGAYAAHAHEPIAKQVGETGDECAGYDPCFLTALHVPTAAPTLDPPRPLWTLFEPTAYLSLESASSPHRVRPPPLAL